MKPFRKDSWIQSFDVSGVHYAVRIFIGAWLAWLLASSSDEINPLWAVISLISVTEPQIKTAWKSFKSQGINTFIGCAIGIAFMVAFGIETWLLPVAATVAAVVSIHVLRMQAGWRTGPTTAALVMSAGLVDKSTHGAMHLASQRTLGVLTGSLVALFVSWIMSMVWMPEAVAEDAKKVTK